MPKPPPVSFSTQRTPPNALRLRRLALGLRQQDVADVAGISREQIGKLETGQATDPHLSTVQALACALGCVADDLFPLNDDDRAPTRSHATTAPAFGAPRRGTG